ncbi:hypothetical protein [Pedobacter endophyticus]|uniref:TonB-dependent receptor n=1 Tax=Pedobacter endophyticus TaxID=2789740 RepID=A0A7U3Q503_9SPHI|nr:hypothetical protein [Pedobacter endophyticus]QPH38713.1 hypothetical protein IZT61_16795 [Pedobacter endophyticus]
MLRRYNGVTNNLIANTNLRYTILPGLNAKANFGYTNTRLEQIAAVPASSQNPANNPTSSANFTNLNGDFAKTDQLISELRVSVFGSRLTTPKH